MEVFGALLDPDVPLDPQLFDRAVIEGWCGNSQEATDIVTQVAERRPDSLELAEAILEGERFSVHSRMAAFMIIRDFVCVRWDATSEEQCDQIRSFIKSFLSDPTAFPTLLSTANQVFIEILKFEWPGRSPDLVSELVSSGNSSPEMCQNCMLLLRMLAQELGEFSDSNLTTSQTADMTAAFQATLPAVVPLIHFAFQSQNDELILETLRATKAFIRSTTDHRIFAEANFLGTICSDLLPNARFTLECIAVFSELASSNISFGMGQNPIAELFVPMVEALGAIIPDSIRDPEANLSADFLYTFAGSMTSLIQPRPSTAPIIRIDESDAQPPGFGGPAQHPGDAAAYEPGYAAPQAAPDQTGGASQWPHQRD
jgi:exportin-1